MLVINNASNLQIMLLRMAHQEVRTWMVWPYTVKGELYVRNSKYPSCLLVLFSVAFGSLFNLLLSHMTLSLIVIMSSAVHKACLDFIKACSKNGDA